MPYGIVEEADAIALWNIGLMTLISRIIAMAAKIRR